MNTSPPTAAPGPHLGREVTVTGDVIEKAHREAAKNGNPAENEYLRVTQIREVNNACR